MIVSLNTGKQLHSPIFKFRVLKNATINQLLNYELISNGIGIHWPDVYEDLSLKGFINDELKKCLL